MGFASSVVRPDGIVRERAPRKLIERVYGRDKYTCVDCGHAGEPAKVPGSIQAYYKQSLAEGGEHTLSNMITVCYACRLKRNKLRHPPRWPRRPPRTRSDAENNHRRDDAGDRRRDIQVAGGTAGIG